MSTIVTRDLTQNFGAADRDTSKIFIFDNSYRNVTFKNDTGADINLIGGELVAIDPSDGTAVIIDVAASDGTEVPVGFVNSCPTVLDTETAPISICIGGDVVEDKIILPAGVTLDTVVGTRQLRDLITAETMGTRIVPSTELTNFDN